MNNFKCKKLIATALTFVIFMALVQQPLLTAKERRGATVVVTMIDGSLVKGELLTVKADALLVYDQDAGQGKNIDLQQVVQVKVLKKSKALLGLAIGLGVGLGFCALNPDMAGHANAGIGQIYIPLMSLSGLGGGLLGAFAGITDKFSLVGASSRNLQQNLKRLKHFAREQDFEKSSPPVSADSISSQPEAQSHGAQQQRQPRHRFRLLWLPGSQFSSGNIDFSAENGTFRFVGGPPAESTTVYQFKLVPQYDLNHLKIGQLRLEYELTPHFSSSLEFFARGGSFTDYMYETLSYYSTEHAGRYESTIFVSNNYTYSSLLLGLNWKPFALSFANRNIFELGISVGPALAQVNLDNSYDEDPIRVKKFTTLTWSCKVHAAYDYFYNDNFSLGVFIAYQYLCPSFPNFTFFNEEQPFRPERDFFSDPILRPTEFTVPGRKIQLGGMALGIRVGAHF
jgi:hypothetical protein